MNIRIARALVCLCPLLFLFTAFAAETDLGEVAFRQALLDCGTDLRLMCVAAHPDDEDGATLAMYRKKYGYHTIAVIATRGEGGQNEIGPELYNALGVIRTHEMMRASAITGADLHFLNLPEFGFSKSPEEAFAVWGHDETVKRLVRVIRMTQPDVIITNHGTQKDHGHHQAIGIAVQEAFDAAGDPAKFPELEKDGLKAWQPQALYLRVWGPTDKKVVGVDFYELDKLRGKTYAAIAAEALQEHKSQGMGFFIDMYLTQKISATYTLVKSHPDSKGGHADAPGGVLFEGLVPDRLVDRSSSQGDPVLAALRQGSVENGKPIIETLAASDASAYEARAKSPVEARQWKRLNRALAIGMELRLSGNVDDTTFTPGETAQVHAIVKDFGDADAISVSYHLEPAPWFKATLSDAVTVPVSESHSADGLQTFVVPNDQPFTVPNPDHLFDAHFSEPQVTLVAEVTTTEGKAPIELRLPLTIDVAPQVQVEFLNAPYLLRRDVDKSLAIDVLLTNNAHGPSTGTLSLSVAPGLTVEKQQAFYAFAAKGEQTVISFPAKVGDKLDSRDYVLNAIVTGDDTSHFALARMVDLALPEKLRVGVVQSYDDTFVKTLARLSIPHEALTVADFTPERLTEFTSIIVDIRAYLVREDLVSNNQALLNYVSNGGNVIVMYQKTEEWKPEFAPYPIRVSRNRVTVETAPIKLLVANHPLFTTPNVIQPEDWDGWLQERGLYFPDEWDSHYVPLIACTDPGEDIPAGSCLFANYGKGTYLYTALGWYRQLRELHPGALRLFANMLALHGQ